MPKIFKALDGAEYESEEPMINNRFIIRPIPDKKKHIYSLTFKYNSEDPYYFINRDMGLTEPEAKAIGDAIDALMEYVTHMDGTLVFDELIPKAMIARNRLNS